MWTDSSRSRSSRQRHTWPWLDEQRALRCGAAAGMAPVCHGGLRLYRGAATLSTPCGEPHKTRPAPRSLSVVVARDPQVTHAHGRKTPTSVLSYVPTIRQSVSHGFWSVVTEASRPRGPVSGITGWRQPKRPVLPWYTLLRTMPILCVYGRSCYGCRLRPFLVLYMWRPC